MNDTPEDRSEERQAAEQDLHATNDAIRADALRLAELEDEKSTKEGDDPAVDELAEEAVDLGERIARGTRAERQLGSELG